MSRGWRLYLTPQAERDLNRLPEKAAAAVLETLVHIEADPKRLGKPLVRELSGLYSARRGPYRIIYRLDGKRRRVEVVVIAHRADAYRRR